MVAATAEATIKIKHTNPTTIVNTIRFLSITFPPFLLMKFPISSGNLNPVAKRLTFRLDMF
jgi:hypothetical protein